MGAIQLVAEVRPGVFSSDDLDLLSHVALQVSFAVETMKLHQDVLREREAEVEMSMACRIQLSMLPSQPPSLKGFELDDFYNPAREVGGDYYNYIQLRDGRTAVFIADVAGKGVPAAMVVVSLATLMKVYLSENESPVSVMNRLNRDYDELIHEDRYLTLALVVIDDEAGEVEIINAGHLPPIIRYSDNRVEEISKEHTGLALGIDPNRPYEPYRVRLETNEAIILYTDGITDARSKHGDDYSRNGLVRCIERTPGRAGELCEGIMSDIKSYADGAAQQDDMCLICISRTSPVYLFGEERETAVSQQ